MLLIEVCMYVELVISSKDFIKKCRDIYQPNQFFSDYRDNANGEYAKG
jgi:hypothetical protein